MTTMSDLIPSPRFLAELKERDAKHQAARAEARYREVVEALRAQNRAYWARHFNEEPPALPDSWFATHQHLENPNGR